MKVLVLGGAGMLGHKLCQVFGRKDENGKLETYATFRRLPVNAAAQNLFNQTQVIEGVSVEDWASVKTVVAQVNPQVVINCIGIVKQLAAAKDYVASIETNALFPHRVARLCAQTNRRLIHISTDCVFSGRQGNYAESDTPNAEDLYGRTKLLGEVVDSENCITLRTSIIGRELSGAHGLVEWFLSQSGKQVKGFNRAVFSGWTTLELARLIKTVIMHHKDLSGLYHVAAEAITKYDLLRLIKDVYGLEVEIERDDVFACDRTLNALRFRQATKLRPLAWQAMVEEMHRDETPYEDVRKTSFK